MTMGDWRFQEMARDEYKRVGGLERSTKNMWSWIV